MAVVAFSSYEEVDAEIAEKRLTKRQRAIMDVPLELKDIDFRYGLKGYKVRKSLTFRNKTDVVGLFVILLVTFFCFVS